MGTESSQLRVVLDTNVVVSALLFQEGHVSWLRPLWTGGRILPLVSSATAGELLPVLAYPKFGLDEDEIRTVLAAYLPFAEVVTVPARTTLPACRDPYDQIFLDLALVGLADVLVTGDAALLEMAGQVSFSIEAPADFKKRFP
jgi:putative PIN family toxin of toxin-antitoxin system